jgi:hypothetical protein
MAEIAAKNAGTQISSSSGFQCLFAYFKFASNEGLQTFRDQVIQQNISDHYQELGPSEITFVLQ